jgi:hypothetical protein
MAFVDIDQFELNLIRKAKLVGFDFLRRKISAIRWDAWFKRIVLTAPRRSGSIRFAKKIIHSMKRIEVCVVPWHITL